VRLTEQLGENVDAIATAVKSKLPGDLEPQRAIGVAGTIMSLAALDLGLESYDRDRVHGHRLSAEAVARQVSALAAMSLEERRQLPALDPKRAPVIVAGAVILREVLRRFSLDEIEASERDLLDGVALEAAQLPEPVERDAPPGAYVCC
jgi:exopolyphosphatase/guanosine-5'-triphosphate,3'-diphosphate pyrophosphatase